MPTTAASKPGRPAIPTAMQSFVLDVETGNKFNSLRFDADKGAKSPLLTSVYLNRAAYKAMGVPEGRVPTKVEITVRALKTEAIAPPVPKA